MCRNLSDSKAIEARQSQRFGSLQGGQRQFSSERQTGPVVTFGKIGLAFVTKVLRRSGVALINSVTGHQAGVERVAEANVPHQVLLGIHLDTVYGSDHRFQSVDRSVDDENQTILHGPGVADAKGGVSVMLTAFETFAATDEKSQNVGWRLFLNPDEEIGSLGSNHSHRIPILACCMNRRCPTAVDRRTLWVRQFYRRGSWSCCARGA